MCAVSSRRARLPAFRDDRVQPARPFPSRHQSDRAGTGTKGQSRRRHRDAEGQACRTRPIHPGIRRGHAGNPKLEMAGLRCPFGLTNGRPATEQPAAVSAENCPFDNGQCFGCWRKHISCIDVSHTAGKS